MTVKCHHQCFHYVQMFRLFQNLCFINDVGVKGAAVAQNELS